MLKPDAEEAAAIIVRTMDAILSVTPTRGRPGSDLRLAAGDLRANAVSLIHAGTIGGPLAKCFEVARVSGITLKAMGDARTRVLMETPVSLTAKLITQACIGLCLVIEAKLISRMKFTSRQDVDALKAKMNLAFNEAEESAADIMDAARYRAIVQLHAAAIFHLTETARPLPRMINFSFAAPMPTLLISQRLYYNGGRADELRAENSVVHPAFAPRAGQALSA
jgi:hypothetical protein